MNTIHSLTAEEKNSVLASVQAMNLRDVEGTAFMLGQWWDDRDQTTVGPGETLLKERLASELTRSERDAIKVEMRKLLNGDDFFVPECVQEERSLMIEGIIRRLFPVEKVRKYGPSQVVLRKTQEIARMACSV